MGANGLAVARTLGREGVPVVGIDSRPDAPGFASKFVRKLVVKDIKDDPEALLQALLRAGEGQDEKGLIFPASDAAVLFLSKNEKALSEQFIFLTPPEKVREAMINKRLQHDEAIRLGIPVPVTHFPVGPADLEEVESTVSYPAFIKPLYSHRWCTTFANKGFIVTTTAELRERMATVFASGHEVMVQSIIWPPGKDLYSVGAFFDENGKESPTFCWHKLRQYPPSFGVGSLVESAHQPEVTELGLRYMKGIGYRGIGYVEFKKDQKDGEWKMVEMNARTGQTNALQAKAGRPLVLYQYCHLTGRPYLPRSGDYPDGVRWWDSLNDIDSFWRLRRRGEITTFQWIRSCLQVDVNAYFDLNDPVPLFVRYGYGSKLAKLTNDLLKMKVDEDQVLSSDDPVATVRKINAHGPDSTRTNLR
ncbi:MAG: hypothetical protein GXX95_03860 [Methanomassiliicoccus sp.]|nr:hypothetical protein [Methanomassiliicoccus sp.]